MKRELPWSVRLPIGLGAMILALLLAAPLIAAYGSELPIAQHRGKTSIKLILKRENRLPPKYVAPARGVIVSPDDKVRKVAVPSVADRPAGTP
jgi:hypothetical protein